MNSEHTGLEGTGLFPGGSHCLNAVHLQIKALHRVLWCVSWRMQHDHKEGGTCNQHHGLYQVSELVTTHGTRTSFFQLTSLELHNTQLTDQNCSQQLQCRHTVVQLPLRWCSQQTDQVYLFSFLLLLLYMLRTQTDKVTFLSSSSSLHASYTNW